ncbi:MAG: hypothetical protein Q8N88_02985 [Nanoarchaeota archaeon]|nr:hypothetical protein [Nanoarchaeota archaeon]
MIGYVIAGVILFVVVILVIMYIIMKSTGKIILNLNKFDFAENETISGSVSLNLKKPVQANGLYVKLVGERSFAKFVNGHNETKTENIFELVKNIDGEKMYPIGEQSYNFEIKIPSSIKQTTGNQIADTLVKSVQIFSGQNLKINWYIIAYLDMKGFDISKKVRVCVN